MPQVTKAGFGILWALHQVGKSYRMGAEAKLLPRDFANPYAFAEQAAFDCSELAQCYVWAAGVAQVGDTLTAAFDGAGNQYLACPKKISIDIAAGCPGALVFIQDAAEYPDKPSHIGHVAIVIAKNTIVEARGRAYGVVVGPLRPSFNLGAKIKELYV